ncbi:hypothetical protein AAE478_010042 [Parahypoxylon ruwenzoriense]
MDSNQTNNSHQRVTQSHGPLVPKTENGNQTAPRTDRHPTTTNERLEQACSDGNLEGVQKLLREDIGKNKGKDKGNTEQEYRLDTNGITSALFVAINKNHQKIAEEIAAVGRTRLEQQDEESGRTVLHKAVIRNHSNVVKGLLRQSDSARYVNLKDRDGRTALHVAAFRGSHNIMKDLLAKQADIDATDNQYLTPLHLVVLYCSPETAYEKTAKILLDNRAQVNSKNSYGDSPLHDACRKADESMVVLLFEHGANPDSYNDTGETPEAVIPNNGRGDDVKRHFRTPREKWSKYTLKMPNEEPQCSDDKICGEFFVTVRFYWRVKRLSWVQTASVHNLLYDNSTLKRSQDEFVKIIKSRHPKHKADIKDIWKWIHLPANNISWVKVEGSKKDDVISGTDNNRPEPQGKVPNDPEEPDNDVSNSTCHSYILQIDVLD